MSGLGEVKSEDVDDTRMTLVNGARFRQLNFPGHTRRIKKGLDIKCALAIGFQTILVAIGSRMAARDGKSAERKVRMCAQLNRHSPLPRLRCWPVSETKGPRQNQVQELPPELHCKSLVPSYSVRH
jgi:hypothetical protein